MNILISNDDGIGAQGIKELADALADAGADIYVFAPDGQRSASGHSITVAEDIIAEETGFDGAEFAMKLSGTPADCVKLGMKILRDKGVVIDMVFSGINHGGNLGTDTLYSGTVSAAVEGSICGVPSVAVSVNSHEAQYFDYARHLAVKAMENAGGRMSSETILNINTPDLPAEQIKGLKYATLGKREYKEFFAPVQMDGGRTGYRYNGDPVVYEGLPDTIDVIAMQDGYATITPLHRDLTDYGMIEEIKKWRMD